MASRGISPGPDNNPRNIGIDMRQGGDPFFNVPHGLAASMKQGDGLQRTGKIDYGVGSTMRQGSGNTKAHGQKGKKK